MARSHRMTPKRRAALRKAQAASARKRRGKGKGKLAAANRSNNRLKTSLKAVGTAAAIGAVVYASHRGAKSYRSKKIASLKSQARGRIKARQTGKGPKVTIHNVQPQTTAQPQRGLRLASKYSGMLGRFGGTPRAAQRKPMWTL